MVSEREKAKGAITEQDETDPELGEALSEATGYQLELTKENNRHKERQRAQDLGLVGKIIGGENHAPSAVALFVVIVGFMAAIGCWIAAANFVDQAEFWAKQAERALGIGMAALTFLFGKGSK